MTAPDLILFDFGDTLARLRRPLGQLQKVTPASLHHPAGRLLRPPGPLRRALRRPLHRLAARCFVAFPETRPVLEELHRRGYRLGLVSNNTALIFHQLASLDLGRFFPVVTYSEEVGEEKPLNEVFAVALGRHGARAEQAVHVGDSPHADVVGAQRAGIRPVLVDRQGRYRDVDVERVVDLRGLLDLFPARSPA